MNSVRISRRAPISRTPGRGETVTLTVLAVDARTSKPEPAHLYWLPDPLTGKIFCENPANDAYYSCFTSIPKPARPTLLTVCADGCGRRPSPCAVMTPGRRSHLCPAAGPHRLVHFFRGDIITSHPIERDGSRPRDRSQHGVRGHPELLPVDLNNLTNSLPVGCFDKNHKALDASSYVVGYATVYSYQCPTGDDCHGTTIQNQNPVIAHMLFQGNELDGAFSGRQQARKRRRAAQKKGGVIQHCSAPAERLTVTFDVDVLPEPGERPPRSSERPAARGAGLDRLLRHDGPALGRRASALRPHRRQGDPHGGQVPGSHEPHDGHRSGLST